MWPPSGAWYGTGHGGRCATRIRLVEWWGRGRGAGRFRRALARLTLSYADTSSTFRTRAMSLQTTLQKVDEAIASGDYGLARDRLQGLLATYPDDLTVRRRLGDVYWKLQNPAMAGRYWYLEPNSSPDVVVAREAFERSCGNSAERMLRFLKFKGSIDAMRDTPAGQVLLGLQQRAAEERRPAEVAQTLRDRERDFKVTVTFYSCLFIAASAVLLLLIGLIFVLSKYIH